MGSVFSYVARKLLPYKQEVRYGLQDMQKHYDPVYKELLSFAKHLGADVAPVSRTIPGETLHDAQRTLSGLNNLYSSEGNRLKTVLRDLGNQVSILNTNPLKTPQNTWLINKYDKAPSRDDIRELLRAISIFDKHQPDFTNVLHEIQNAIQHNDAVVARKADILKHQLRLARALRNGSIGVGLGAAGTGAVGTAATLALQPTEDFPVDTIDRYKALLQEYANESLDYLDRAAYNTLIGGQNERFN